MTDLQLVFVYPGDLETRTGGYRYDKRIMAEIQNPGIEDSAGSAKTGETEYANYAAWQVRLISLPGNYPFPDAEHIRAADAQLASIAEGSLVVIDGLAYGVLPEIIARHAMRLKLVALVHHPLALETGLSQAQSAHLKALETQALKHARHIVTTSKLTRNSLADYDAAAEKVTAVLPGTDLYDVAAGSDSETVHLLCVATLTPRKGHAILLNALAELRHLDWHLSCAGAIDRDQDTYADLVAQRKLLNLNDRVSFIGELGDTDLEHSYHRADLFVLASYHEGYGMVLSEAIARALPIVCTSGGAMADTVPEGAGLLVAVGDTQALTGALSRFMEDKHLQSDMRSAALMARENLRGWPQAASEFAALMKTLKES